MVMEPTGGTPRKYISVGRDSIHDHNGIIPELFRSKTLANLFSLITMTDVYPVDYTPEQYIINRQESAGILTDGIVMIMSGHSYGSWMLLNLVVEVG